MSQPIGCVVIVSKDNKILLGKRKNGFKAGTYGLPGGRVEVAEKLAETAKREFEEETGLRCDNLEYVGIVKENQGGYDFIHFVFKCEEFEGEPKNVEPEKCEGWEWFDSNNLPAPMLEGHVWAIDIIKNNTKQNLREC